MKNNKTLEKIIQAPTEGLEKAEDVIKDITGIIRHNKQLHKAEVYWKQLGPGLTTGAADDDPSGIGTYSQAGAQYGYSLSWLALFTFPFMSVIQEMCARIGLVTGRGLAANIRRHFPGWMLYASTILLFSANAFNIGADLGAMAKATQLIIPNLNFGFLIFAFAGISLLLQIYTSYKTYAKYLKWLSLVLLAYVFSALTLNLNWWDIFKSTLIPHLTFNQSGIFLICGILGTTISPYLFFWQTSQEVEEEILMGKTTIKQRHDITTKKEIKKMRVDVWTGMFFSNLVMFFIIITCAATLNQAGITNIASADQAALALKPFAGKLAYFLFTLGIIGTGFLAVPVLAGSASYAISETMGWKTGLFRKIKQAESFYGIIILAMIVGMALNFFGIHPIKALIYSAVFNGVVAPFILFFIVKLASDPKIMENHTSGKLSQYSGWLITILMSMVAIATLFFILS